MSEQQFFTSLFTRQLVAVAGEALLIHDYLLTFRLEVDHIWRAPWSAVKTIFLLNRYGNLVGQTIFTLEELGLLSQNSVTFCSRFVWFMAFYAIISEESVHILVLLRAWAIWGCGFRVAIAMVAAYIIYLSASIGSLVRLMVVSSKEKTGVCFSPSSSTYWVLPVIAFSLDVVVSVMIAYSLYNLFRVTRYIRRSPILRVLAKDSALYFVANAITSSIAIVCQIVYMDDPRNMLMLGCFPLLTVTGQRLVLNIRSEISRPHTEQTMEPGPSLRWIPTERRTSRRRMSQVGDVEPTDNSNSFELFIINEP